MLPTGHPLGAGQQLLRFSVRGRRRGLGIDRVRDPVRPESVASKTASLTGSFPARAESPECSGDGQESAETQFCGPSPMRDSVPRGVGIHGRETGRGTVWVPLLLEDEADTAQPVPSGTLH